MAEWTVWVDGWQHQCCGEPFVVGDQVRWALGFAPVSATDASLATNAVFEVMPPPAGSAGSMDPAHEGPLLVAGGLVAQWTCESNAPLSGRRSRLRGLLCEEHHDRVSPATPLTSGWVRSIAIASHHYREQSPRSFERDQGRSVALSAKLG